MSSTTAIRENPKIRSREQFEKDHHLTMALGFSADEIQKFLEETEIEDLDFEAPKPETKAISICSKLMRKKQKITASIV